MTLRDDADLREELNGFAPRLRRYARALATGTGTHSELADELVHATLMRALGARHNGAASDLLIRLYATVTQINREIALPGRQAQAAGGGGPAMISSERNFSTGRPTRLSAALLGLPLESREVLLLVGLEGFAYGDAARILRISKGVLVSRLGQARAAFDAALRTEPAPTPAARRVPYLRLVT